MEPLRERWRPRGVTVNDLLLCALSRSLETHFEAPPGVGVGFITTADFRNLLPPEDLVCNLSGLRGLALGVSPLPPPETHLMAVQARTRRWKATGRGLLAALMGLALASILPDGLVRRAVRRRLEALGRSSRGMHIGFTNLGLLDARRLDFGQGPALDAFIVAPVVRPPLLVIAASGCAGHIHVSLGFHEPALPSERVRVLLDGVLRELHALSGGHPGAV
jgi:NRPS condensation-like uncharacterized protein